MNKVVTINLHGTAYQLEEAGYEVLRAYLDAAARKLEGNPDRDEIIADIEQAIGDKCRAVTNAYRTVVSTKDIERIIAEMGPVDNGTDADPATDTSTTSAGTSSSGTTPPPPPDPGSVRRIYRIQEGAIISGVCNGIAAYFGIDPNLIRAGFVLLALLGGFVSFFPFSLVLLAYLALVILLPTAKTDAEKAAAQGLPATAQEFIRRAREGYYDATRTFKDKEAHRAWKRKFRQEMRGWRRGFQHEMHAQTSQWQSSWASWQQHPGAYRGLWFTVMFLSLVGGILTLLWLFALISLVTHQSAFGIALPTSMPLWVGLVIASLIYAVMISPVRGVRHALRHQGWGGGPCGGGLFGVFDTLFGFAFLALMIWLADRYVPHAHEVILHVLATLRGVADSIRDWWISQ